MRVTGGIFRSRSLATPNGPDIRPTSDRVREAIFSMLGQEFKDLSVLDLFAGTGCLGIEALSRGARRAAFVDISAGSIALIQKNLARCGLEHAGWTVKHDLTKGLEKVQHLLEGPFERIFLDPPYDMDVVPWVLEHISTGGFLSQDAMVVAETAAARPPPALIARLRLHKTRIHGDTRINIYVNEDLS